MNFKTLLLGSAAAMIVAGGAQAADLTVAEPVDYVKVCDAFGAGYFYSPGTDTCIKIGGYVKFGTSVGNSDFGNVIDYYPGNNWTNFYTETSINVTASSVTEFGTLTGWIDYRAVTGNSGNFSQSFDQVANSVTKSAYIDSAWLSLGPVKAGYFTSLFDFSKGYTDTGFFGSDSSADQVQLTYAVNGFGLALSVEDQRDRGGAPGILSGSSTTYVPVPDPSNPGYYITQPSTVYVNSGGGENIPNVIGAITYASGIFSTKIAAAYTQMALERTGTGSASNPYNYDAQTGWAVGGNVTVSLDSFSPGDGFTLSAIYGDNANSFTGIAGGTSVAGLAGFGSVTSQFNAAIAPGTSWSVGASYKHVWTPTLWSAIGGGYASYDGDGTQYNNYNVDAWRAIADIGWTPVKGLDLLLEGQYNSVSGDGPVVGDNLFDGDAWTVYAWAKRSW